MPKQDTKIANLLSFNNITKTLKSILNVPFKSYIYKKLAKTDKKTGKIDPLKYVPIADTSDALKGLFTYEIGVLMNRVANNSDFSRINQHTLAFNSKTGKWNAIPAIKDIRTIVSADVITNQVAHISEILELSIRFHTLSCAMGYDWTERYPTGITDSDLNMEEKKRIKELKSTSASIYTKLQEKLTDLIVLMSSEEQYRWLYSIINNAYCDNGHLKRNHINDFLSIILILSLDIHNDISDPYQTLPIFRDAVSEYVIRTTKGIVPAGINETVNVDSLDAKPTPVSNGMISTRIKENQQIEEIEVLWKELLTQMFKDLFSDLILESYYSTEIKELRERNLDAINAWELAFDRTPTYHGKLSVYQSAKEGHQLLLGETHSLISSFTHNRSK